MKSFVVYTVQTGGYDVVRQPLVVDKRFDYVLFSDSTEQTSIGIWEVRQIPYTNDDLTRLSRYPKMHPHILLREYKASLYIDANIQIAGQRIYDRIVECYEKGIDWASTKHPYRNCIYDEAYAVYGLESENNIFKWCHRLRKEHYPRNIGLVENGVTYRRHVQIVEETNNLWWELYEEYTRRDQLTLYYVFWKTPNLKTSLLLPEGESVWNSDTIKINKHQKVSKQSGRRGVKESFLEHARNRCRCGMEERKESFKEFHYWLYGLNPTIARILLSLWGWYALVVYGVIIKYRAYKRHRHEK